MPGTHDLCSRRTQKMSRERKHGSPMLLTVPTVPTWTKVANQINLGIIGKGI